MAFIEQKYLDMLEYDKAVGLSWGEGLELKWELLMQINHLHTRSWGKVMLLFCICLGLAVFSSYHILQEPSDYLWYVALLIAAALLVRFWSHVVEGYRIAKRLERIGKKILAADAETVWGRE